MARQTRSELDDIFTALADPTRRAMLAQLAQSDACVGELAAPHDMSFAAVSRHLQVLVNTGLVSRRKEGRKFRCRSNATPLDAAANWLTHHRALWQQKLDALGEFLEDGK